MRCSRRRSCHAYRGGRARRRHARRAAQRARTRLQARGLDLLRPQRSSFSIAYVVRVVVASPVGPTRVVARRSACRARSLFRRLIDPRNFEGGRHRRSRSVRRDVVASRRVPSPSPSNPAVSAAPSPSSLKPVCVPCLRRRVAPRACSVSVGRRPR